MHDFSCKDPDEMHYAVLSDRVRFYKEDEKGVSSMCKALEDMCKEAFQEGKQEGMSDMARRMLAAGKYALDEIAEMSGISLDDVKKLQAELA